MSDYFQKSRIVYTGKPVPVKKRRIFEKRIGKGALICFLFFLLLGGGVYLSRLPKFLVSTIEIEGMETIERDALLAALREEISGSYFYLIPKRNYFLIRTEKISDALKKKFPKINEVAMVKKPFRDLIISVKERSLFGLYCVTAGDASSTSCAYIDHTGFAYEEAPSSFGSLILKIKSDAGMLRIGNNVIEPSLGAKMQLLTAGASKYLDISVVGFEFSSSTPREIRLAAAEGFKIFFNQNDDFQNVFRMLRTLMEQEIREKRSRLDYIDARFGNKVFYKLKQ